MVDMAFTTGFQERVQADIRLSAPQIRICKALQAESMGHIYNRTDICKGLALQLRKYSFKHNRVLFTWKKPPFSAANVDYFQKIRAEPQGRVGG